MDHLLNKYSEIGLLTLIRHVIALLTSKRPPTGHQLGLSIKMLYSIIALRSEKELHGLSDLKLLPLPISQFL